MYNKMSKNLALLLLENKSIKEENYEIYRFGLEQVISNYFGFVFLTIVAFILSAPIGGIIFYVTFKYMRIYAGGYHANTYVSCNTMYLLIFSFAVVFSRNFQDLTLSIIFVLFSGITVLILSPIENKNHPIIKEKYFTFYKYSILVVLVLVVVQFFLVLSGSNLYKLIAVTMFLAAIFMWIEIIKRRDKAMRKLKKKVCDLLAKQAQKSAMSTCDTVSLYKMYQPKSPSQLNEFYKNHKK